MKKIYFSAFLLASVAANAQIFSEDFDSGLPSTWTVMDVDGLTPNSSNNNLSTAGWHAITTSKNVGNTSWYDPAGVANDWLISPQISIPSTSTNPFLKFDERSPDANFPNSYNVLISTTGTATSDFTAIESNVTGSASAITRYFDLSAYKGDDIHVALQDISNDKFILLVDNFEVVDLADNDISLLSVSFDKFVGVPSSQSLDVVVSNSGAETITSYKVNWTYDGTPDSYTVTGVNIPVGQSHQQSVNLDIPVNSAAHVPFTVELELTGDANTADNNGEGDIYGLSDVPNKRVLMEEATGSWCGWCPRGSVGLDKIDEDEPDNVVAIAVHNGDPMAVAEHDGNMNVSGYPSANADRKVLGFDPGDFTGPFNQLKDNVSPASVSVYADFDAASNSITVTPTVNFKTSLTGDFSVSVIAIEDWVHGTGSGFNQSNYYAGGGNGVMGGYESKPNPVPAADMYYRHVSRGFVGTGIGFAGDNTIIPNTVVAGTDYTIDYSYTVPSDVAIGHLHFAVVLIDNDTKEVINANKLHYINNVVGVEEFSTNFTVTPNPAKDVITLTSSVDTDATVRIVNGLGQVVSTYSNNDFVNGTTYDVSNLESGVYYITITEGSKIATKKLVIE